MSARLHRALRAARHDDTGISLVEVLVTMVVSSVLLAAISAMVINGVRTADAANQRNDATAQMRTATDRMTKQLRTAASYDGSVKPFIVAERERVGFYAKLDTLDLSRADVASQEQVPSVVWLWTRNGAGGTREVCQQVYRAVPSGAGFTWPAGAQSPTATRTCQVVARNLSRTPARPLFTFLKATDATMRADGSSVSTVPVDGAGAVVGNDITTIGSVEVWMESSVRTQDTVQDHATVARVTFINLGRS